MHQIHLFSRQCILMIEVWATLRLAHWVLLTYKARTAFEAAWHGWRDLPLFKSFWTQISILRISSKHFPCKKLMKNFPFLQRLIYRRDPWWETDFATLRWSPKLVSVTVSWGRFSKWCSFDRLLSQSNWGRGESCQSEFELVSNADSASIWKPFCGVGGPVFVSRCFFVVEYIFEVTTFTCYASIRYCQLFGL